MREVIVYLVNALSGGVDGLDHTDKGGLVKAYWFRPDAEGYVKTDTRYGIKPEVIDVDKAQLSAIAKLSPLDRLVLGITVKASGRVSFTDPNAGHNER